MIKILIGLKKYSVRLMINSLSGMLILVAIGLPLYIHNLPDLEPWHTQILTNEFTADGPVKTFKDYLALEEDLFRELDKTIEDPLDGPAPLNRFYKGSYSHPKGSHQNKKNWNRTFELKAANPRIGVLLLHGMSDSPYSLRQISHRLNKEGGWVVGLRLPGHGTTPSGLLNATWQDMAAAARLALTHLEKQVQDQPLYIIGYSTGGALGLYHTLAADTPKIHGLVQISPAIGISPMAPLAGWNKRLSHIPGFEKLAWVDLQPEYNPYKYNSFPANAGDQVYRLTREIQKLISETPEPQLETLPPILAFQSIADATVSVNALIDRLFNRLPGPAHELIIFDINRIFDLNPLISKPPATALHSLVQKKEIHFTLGLLTNESQATRQVHLKIKSGKRNDIIPLDMAWPRGIYSLSHVALPFSEQDPLYGRQTNQPTMELNLGDIALRGERGILKIPPSEILRLKWNPFYTYMENRILQELFTEPIIDSPPK